MERVLFHRPWECTENPDGPDSFCTKNEMMMMHDSDSHFFQFYYVPGTVKCFIHIITLDSLRNPRDCCQWHLSFTDEDAEISEVKCLPRVNLLGI